MLKYHPPEDKGMSASLLGRLDVDMRDSYKESFKQSSFLLDPIRSVVLDKLNNHLIPPAHDYESRAWDNKQADRLGYIRALEEVLNLLY